MINPAKTYTLDEYIEILHRRILFIVIPFLLIVIGGTIYAFTATKQYKASTLILVSPQKVPEAFVQSTAQEVMSRTSLGNIITELRLYEKERQHRSLEEIIELMRKNVKIELPTTRGEKVFFTISFIGNDPNTVATVANRLSSLFIEENLESREQQAASTTEFLVDELAEAKAKLGQMEARVGQYKRPKKDQLKRELEDLRTKYTDNHPDVVAMKKKIADLEKNKDTSDSESQVNKYKGGIEQTPSHEQDMGALGREYQSMKATYEALLKRSQEARQAANLEKRQRGELFRIIDPAIVPERSFFPNVFKILLISLFAGLASGLALAFIREQMDRSFHDSADVEISLGIKVLATIPKIEEKAS